MSMNIKASIIIPVYNGKTTIERALNSALNQTTEEPYEIIAIDDGSKDGSGDILDQYAKKHEIIHVIHQKNQGITRTRENGIKAAQGTFVYWIDADDYADPALLSKTLPLLDKGNDVVIYGARYFYRDGSTAKEKVQKTQKTDVEWKRKTLDATLSTLWVYATRKEYWEGEVAPGPVSRSAADGYMTIRIFSKAKHSTSIPDILYYHLEDSPFSIRHTFNGKRYLGNAYLWFYRLKISEKEFPDNIEHCAARAFTGYVRSYAMDTVTHDLSDEERNGIKKALVELRKYPISGRFRDKCMAWAIFHNQLWICRLYANHKADKTKKKNQKWEKE